MKHLLNFVFVSAVLLPVAIYGVDVSPKNEAESQILEFFSKWRNGDILPFSLPPLDVITIPPLNGSYSGKGIKFSYSASELRLYGVNNFSVVKLDVSIAALRASGLLVIPTLSIFAESYELEGKAFYVYSLKGSGILDITLNDVTLKFGIQLAPKGGEGAGGESGSKVVGMQLDFTIEDIQANLENSSWPINKMLNSEGVKILDGYHEEIVAATRASLVETFDDYLAEKTPTELLDEIQTKE